MKINGIPKPVPQGPSSPQSPAAKLASKVTSTANSVFQGSLMSYKKPGAHEYSTRPPHDGTEDLNPML